MRMLAIRRYAFPAFLGRMATDPRWLPVLYLIPILIFGAIALWAPKPPAAGEMEFAQLFPIPVLEALFFALSGFLLVAIVVSMGRFMAAMRRGGARGSFWGGVVPAFTGIVTHERFAQCVEPGKSTFRYGHQLTLWGFMGLAFMGTVVGMGSMLGILRTPLELGSPLKVFANVSALVILAGGILLLKARLQKDTAGPGATFFDWSFLATLVGVIATGILSEVLRLVQFAPALYVVYFVHLVLIFVLFIYAPYSKFAHFAYRTVAVALSEPWKPKRPVSSEDQKKLIELYY
jgi:quinone-modifying oxidoreductase subunit QmoC